jgi:hypothetical protein
VSHVRNATVQPHIKFYYPLTKQASTTMVAMNIIGTRITKSFNAKVAKFLHLEKHPPILKIMIAMILVKHATRYLKKFTLPD